MTLNDGNYGIFLITGNAGFISSTLSPKALMRYSAPMIVTGVLSFRDSGLALALNPHPLKPIDPRGVRVQVFSEGQEKKGIRPLWGLSR